MTLIENLPAYAEARTKAAEFIGSRWTAAIIWAMLAGCARFREISGAIPDLRKETFLTRDSSDNSFLLGCAAVAFAIVAAFGLMLLSSACKIVGAGERGVVTQWSAPTGDIRGEGLTFVMPLAGNIETMSVQTHAFLAKAVEAASHDLQTVHTDVTVNYSLDPGKVVEIYRTLRRDYESRILYPSTQETVKAVTAQYAAEALITKRAEVRDRIESLLTEKVQSYGLVIQTVSITQFSFSEDFEKAIEAKVTAEQQALKARNDLERIKVEATQKIETAKAEAESIRIRSEALANSPKLVEWEAIQKWDGRMPQVAGGSIPFINIPVGERR